MNIVEKAHEIAIKAHMGQVRMVLFFEKCSGGGMAYTLTYEMSGVNQ